MAKGIGEWNFILGVLFYYGFLYTMYTMSNGMITEFIAPNINIPTPTNYTGNAIIDFLNSSSYMLNTMHTFFEVMFLNPFSGIWWLTAMNWALLGVTVYLFLRLIRGGG